MGYCLSVQATKGIIAIHQLVLDKSFLRDIIFNKRLSHNGFFVSVINSILFLHSGPILKFVLHIPLYYTGCYLELDQWMLLLSRNGIMDLTLANSSAHRYKLPSYIYSCQELRHLKLSKCIFKPPLMFVGFRNLSILHLKKVSFVVNTFENFPLLECMTFVTCLGVQHFHICAPKLRRFTSIDTQDVRWSSFLNSPNLTLVYIALCRMGQYGQGERIDLVKLVGCLPAIVNLSLDGLFLKVSTATGSSMESVVTSYLEAPDCLDQTLDKLQTVNMKFMGSRAELLLIKLLLAHSPWLEKVSIEQSGVVDAYQGFKVSRELMRFSRASPRAEIIFLEPLQQIVR
ncbi:hypothetical protein RJ640_017841 [Escallonia rubra]|uniref:FBD domain-containing protein n=1 Tax=Escallonia rubra TaxID=112253 RepID=A0AA88S800_9ASTE|nr:hypothetical protein RJ640_017841 [Escallonia rubra]